MRRMKKRKTLYQLLLPAATNHTVHSIEKLMKAFVVLALVGLAALAQGQPYFFDTHSNFLAKQFQNKSQDFLDSMLQVEPPEDWHRGLERLAIPLERPLEGNFLQARSESYRFSQQFLNIPEAQWQDAPMLRQKNGWESLAAWQAFPKSWMSEEETAAFPVAYFDSLVAQLFLLKEHQQRIEEDYGRELVFQVCTDRTDLAILNRHPERMGLLLSIGGGHNLGDYGYIERQETQRPEYKERLLHNIAILKGLEPFVYKGQERFLPYPIASIKLASYFDNGICGNSRIEDRKLDRLIGEPLTRHYGMSPLGKEVVRSLLDASKGYRILVDVSGMSRSARHWYYDYLHQMAYAGPTVPIIWTEAGLSGKSWNDADYEAGTDQDDVFFHHSSQMSREDVQAIFDSKGLIGLSLCGGHLLSQTRFKEAYEKIKGQEGEERSLLVQAAALQICRIIHILQDEQAWNIISFSTGFDGQERPFPGLRQTADVAAFAQALKDFFTTPTNLLDTYSAAQVKQFLYGQSPDELVEKLLYGNASAFWQRNLPSDFQDRSSTDSWRAGR